MKSKSIITTLLAFLFSFVNLVSAINSSKDLGFYNDEDLIDFAEQLDLYRYFYEYTKRVAKWNNDLAQRQELAKQLVEENNDFINELNALVENLSQYKTLLSYAITTKYKSGKNGFTFATRDLGSKYINLIQAAIDTANGTEPNPEEGFTLGLKGFREKYQFVVTNFEKNK